MQERALRERQEQAFIKTHPEAQQPPCINAQKVRQDFKAALMNRMQIVTEFSFRAKKRFIFTNHRTQNYAINSINSNCARAEHL